MDSDTVTKFFSGRPIQLRLFDLVRQYLESLGSREARVTKSQISFSNRRQVAWVWLPQPWAKNRPPNCIVLSFGLGRRVDHPQIVQAVEPYPGRWMHHIIIETEADLNENVRKWLREAYEFGA